jgi:hypothetical protein
MVAALLATLIAVIAVKAGRARQQVVATALASACDLGAGPCTAQLTRGAAAEVELTPRPIPLASPMGVAVRVRGADPASAELAITSVTMDMGTTRVSLTRTGPGALAGAEALPVCVSGTMTWIARLTLPGEPEPLTFRFDTRTP